MRTAPLKEFDLVGKTIKNVDASALNSATIFFTDGSHIVIEVEYAGHGVYGMFGLYERING